MKKVGVVGAGAWGTALAIVLRRAGLDVMLWAREEQVLADIQSIQENKIFLPGIKLDAAIQITGDLNDLYDMDFLLMVTPAQFTRAVAAAMQKLFDVTCPVVVCAKGIEEKTGMFLSDAVADVLPNAAVGVLSGPSFAVEVAQGKPTALVVAFDDLGVAEKIVGACGSDFFRPYISNDVRGTQIGGALKNVLAIASGVAMGKNLGDNARAALMARGLSEMTKFAVAYGGQAETLAGLSGLGDLVLTCAGEKSRNLQLGMALARGEKLSDILQSKKSVAEGAHSASVVARMAREKELDLPIFFAVDQILHHGANIDTTIHALLARPYVKE